MIKRTYWMAFGEEVEFNKRASGLGYDEVPETRKRYTGYEKDDESGLDFAQARYYNPKHGRYTSVDPLTVSAIVKNPQTFNRYSYVLNSPYKFSDPLGLLSVETGACGNRCTNWDGSSGGGMASTYGNNTWEDGPTPESNTDSASEPGGGSTTPDPEASSPQGEPAASPPAPTAGDRTREQQAAIDASIEAMVTIYIEARGEAEAVYQPTIVRRLIDATGISEIVDISISGGVNIGLEESLEPFGVGEATSQSGELGITVTSTDEKLDKTIGNTLSGYLRDISRVADLRDIKLSNEVQNLTTKLMGLGMDRRAAIVAAFMAESTAAVRDNASVAARGTISNTQFYVDSRLSPWNGGRERSMISRRATAIHLLASGSN